MEQFSKFEFRDKLNSYEINKEVITTIEKYLIDTLPEICNLEPQYIKSNLKIKINDNIGIEHFSTMEEYSSSLFPNSTEEIEIYYEKFGNGEGTSLELSIKFNKDEIYTYIKIIFEGKNARDKVLAIYNRIKEILRDYKTNYKIFNTSEDAGGFLLFVGGIFVIIEIIFIWSISIHLGIFFTAITILAVGLYLWGKNIFHYSTFDTREYRKNKKMFKEVAITSILLILSELLIPYILFT